MGRCCCLPRSSCCRKDRLLLDDTQDSPVVVDARGCTDMACLLLFACDAKQFDISSDANDILLPLPSDDLSTADAPTPMAHEVSLRAFLEVLYYVRGFPRTCPVTRAQRLACPCPASCL